MGWNPFKRAQKEQTKESVTPPFSKRSFYGAQVDRLTSDFLGSDSLLSDITQGRVPLRRRARDLAINSEYIRKYFKLLKTNVVGPGGVALSMQITNIDGTPDEIINKLIADKFYEWGKYGNPTTCGRLVWIKLQELVIEAVARDGEALCWIRRGPEFGKFNFQIQYLDPEYLDDNFTSTSTEGNIIREGVEYNDYGKAVAFWILSKNPNDTTSIPTKRYRVLAKDVIHIYDPERGSQYRGFSWLAPVMKSIHHLEKYRESELIAARISASRMGFYEQTGSDQYTGADEYEEELPVSHVEPGMISVLPKSWTFKQANWNSPNTEFTGFNKAILRGISAALGVSYNALSSDLESVNYSSSRFGSIHENAAWKSIQRMFVNSFINRVFEEWLETQLLTGSLGFNISKYDKFNQKRFICYSTPSVDPAKEARSNELDIKMKLKSRTEVLAENGKDFEELLIELAREKALMEQYGITAPELLDEQLKIEQAEALDTGVPNDDPNGKEELEY